MSAFDEVLDAARTLTPVDRLRLAQALWNEMSPSERPRPSEEWIAEVRRRSDSYDEGHLSARPWNEVQACARKQLGLDE